MSSTPSGPDLRDAVLGALARAERTRQTTDIDRVRRLLPQLRVALAEVPEDEPDRWALIATTLSQSLFVAAVHAPGTGELDEAIELQGRLLAGLHSDAVHAQLLRIQAGLLNMRFTRRRDANVLEESIRVHRAVLEDTEPDSADHRRWAGELGSQLFYRAQLRAQHPHCPTLWAAHVHTGP